MTNASRFRPRRSRVVGVIGLAALVLAPAKLAAEDPVNPDQALALALGQIPGQPLSLSAAVEAALAHAAPVWVAAAQRRAAAAEVERERGQFDPEVFVDLERSAVDEPSASPFSGAEVVELDQTRAAAGVLVNLPTGTQVEASVVTVRQETNSLFAALDPQYTATGQLRFNQPLLEGFSVAGRRDLSAAEQRLLAADARREQADLWVRARTEVLYWNLYAATRDLAVQRLLRDRALAFRSPGLRHQSAEPGRELRRQSRRVRAQSRQLRNPRRGAGNTNGQSR